MSDRKSFSPGILKENKSTLGHTKEDVRIDQLIPSEILDDRTTLKTFLEKYYEFMNMDEFTYTENESFTDVVLDGIARFRIPDPNNNNDHFFTDETGGASTLAITAPNGTVTNITLNAESITISNGNELPGSLAKSTSEIGKTFTVTGLASHNGSSAKLTTPVRYWVGPGPSYVLNEIERHMDIDENDAVYLDLMQKEIAPIVPRNVLVNKRTLYKQFIDFYKLRGTSDSIETFFRILFNDNVEVEYPYDTTLIPSSGNWEPNAALPKGGQYLDKKGHLSDVIKIHDSLRYQKFSYVVKSGTNITDWNLVFNRLVHPAGFKYFAEILLLIELINAGTVNFRKTLPQVFSGVNRNLFTAIPFRVPGVIGVEDLPVLVEAFASSFTPGIQAFRGRSARFSITLNGTGGVGSIDVIDPGFGYLSAPTLTFNGEGTSPTAPTISLGALNSDGQIDPDNISITNAGSGYTQLFVSASAPVDAQNNSVVGKIVSVKLHGLADKIFTAVPTLTFDRPLEKDADGNFTGTLATATLSLDSEGEVSSVSITGAGSGYTLDPGIKFTTGAQNELRARAQSVKEIIQLNHNTVETLITEVKINPKQTGSVRGRTLYNGVPLKIGSLSANNDWTITQSSTASDAGFEEHRVNVVNSQYRTIEDNGYYKRKGDEFFNNRRMFDTNYPIEFFSSQTIQNAESTVINNYNTNSFINIE